MKIQTIKRMITIKGPHEWVQDVIKNSALNHDHPKLEVGEGREVFMESYHTEFEEEPDS